MKSNLLLLHGALGSIAQFDELQNLLQDFYTVHTFNFSGHGGEAIPGVFSIDSFEQEAYTFIHENNLAPVKVFGYSMGGYVALKLATQHPECISKIMTLGTKFAWSPETAAREVKMLDPDVIEIKIPKFAEMLQARHHPQEWKEVIQKTANMMTSLGNGDAMLNEDFQKINQEVLICVGSEDNMVTVEECENIIRHLPNGNLKIIEGFKHPIEAVNKTELAGIIHSFMK